MSKRREARVEQLVTKMIAQAIENSGNTTDYRGKPSKEFPGEWSALMRVTSLFDDEPTRGKVEGDKEEKE